MISEKEIMHNIVNIICFILFMFIKTNHKHIYYFSQRIEKKYKMAKKIMQLP